MKIWALSLDGNAATRNQTVALATTMQDQLGGAGSWDVEIVRPKAPEGAVKLENNTIITWPTVPTLAQLKKVECAEGSMDAPYPDLIVSCRPEVAAISLAVKRASGGHTQIIHIQNPHDKTGAFDALDLSEFDLIVKQSHETLEGPNVISSILPLHDLTPEKLAEYRADGLKHFPQYETQPATIVALGGSDENVQLDTQDFANFGEDIARLAKGAGDIYVLSSRRTTEDQKQAFIAAIDGCPNVKFDDPEMTYRRGLGLGSSFVVDGGSASMIAECLYKGDPVTVYGYRGKLDTHPLVKMGIWQKAEVAELPIFCPPNPDGPKSELPMVAASIVSALGLPGSVMRVNLAP